MIISSKYVNCYQSHSFKMSGERKKKKTATINYFKTNPMADMETLVMWIPDQAPTVTLRVGQHLSLSLRVEKLCHYVQLCVCV